MRGQSLDFGNRLGRDARFIGDLLEALTPVQGCQNRAGCHPRVLDGRASAADLGLHDYVISQWVILLFVAVDVLTQQPAQVGFGFLGNFDWPGYSFQTNSPKRKTVMMATTRL